MFKRRSVQRMNFSYYSQISKWFFAVGVFVVIVLIWVIYFVSTQYIGKSDATVSGLVFYKEKPLINVNVSLGKESVITDEKGYFNIKNIPYGRQNINLEKDGYKTAQKSVFIWKKNYNAGKISLERDSEKVVTFSGKIYDSFTKKGVKDAVVELGGGNTVTNEGGEFSFDGLEKGSEMIKISAIGYQDIEEEISLNDAQNISKDFFLSPYGKVSFTSSREGKKNIYSVSYDGKNLKNYTAKIKGDCWSGQFTSDGKRIVFYSNFGDGASRILETF